MSQLELVNRSKDNMAESQEVDNGWIPASKRPDGTWRKARRVKEGYVPPDEAEKYASKGKQWVQNTSSSLPPGLSEDVKQSKTAAKMSKNRKKNERKKQQREAKKEQEEDGVRNDGVEEVMLPMSAVSLANNVEKMDDAARAKKIKNLKKKLRQIEELEVKIDSGELKELTKEQQEKLNRRKDIDRELKRLEV